MAKRPRHPYPEGTRVSVKDVGLGTVDRHAYDEEGDYITYAILLDKDVPHPRAGQLLFTLKTSVTLA